MAENDLQREKKLKSELKDRVLPLSQIEKLNDPWEKESRLPSFPGTFDDFNQMVIQYGYLALFAPACPLAPILAFINVSISDSTRHFFVVPVICWAYVTSFDSMARRIAPRFAETLSSSAEGFNVRG
eukprot:SAG31_NODE_3685_length_3989_cov_1.633419_5_plen_127_part_00